jgi:hypothetical protein
LSLKQLDSYLFINAKLKSLEQRKIELAQAVSELDAKLIALNRALDEHSGDIAVVKQLQPEIRAVTSQNERNRDSFNRLLLLTDNAEIEYEFSQVYFDIYASMVLPKG